MMEPRMSVKQVVRFVRQIVVGWAICSWVGHSWVRYAKSGRNTIFACRTCDIRSVG
jgi:hypothetical protein